MSRGLVEKGDCPLPSPEVQALKLKGLWIFYIMFIYVSTVYLQSPMPPLYVCATQWHMNVTWLWSRDVSWGWGNIGGGRGTSVVVGEYW